MPAYIVADVEIDDLDRYKEYRKMTGPTLQQYGGKPLVVGTGIESLEGEWSPKRMVILEFPSVEQAKAWWSSEAYKDPKSIRQQIGRTNMIVVEGLRPRT